MNMEDSIGIIPKGLFIGHPKLSKKSKNTSLGSKLRELCIGQVDHFLQNCQKSNVLKFALFAKWAQRFMLAPQL